MAEYIDRTILSYQFQSKGYGKLARQLQTIQGRVKRLDGRKNKSVMFASRGYGKLSKNLTTILTKLKKSAPALSKFTKGARAAGTETARFSTFLSTGINRLTAYTASLARATSGLMSYATASSQAAAAQSRLRATAVPGSRGAVVGGGRGRGSRGRGRQPFPGGAELVGGAGAYSAFSAAWQNITTFEEARTSIRSAMISKGERNAVKDSTALIDEVVSAAQELRGTQRELAPIAAYMYQSNIPIPEIPKFIRGLAGFKTRYPLENLQELAEPALFTVLPISQRTGLSYDEVFGLIEQYAVRHKTTPAKLMKSLKQPIGMFGDTLTRENFIDLLGVQSSILERGFTPGQTEKATRTWLSRLGPASPIWKTIRNRATLDVGSRDISRWTDFIRENPLDFEGLQSLIRGTLLEKAIRKHGPGQKAQQVASDQAAAINFDLYTRRYQAMLDEAGLRRAKDIKKEVVVLLESGEMLRLQDIATELGKHTLPASLEQLGAAANQFAITLFKADGALAPFVRTVTAVVKGMNALAERVPGLASLLGTGALVGGTLVTKRWWKGQPIGQAPRGKANNWRWFRSLYDRARLAGAGMGRFAGLPGRLGTVLQYAGKFSSLVLRFLGPWGMLISALLMGIPLLVKVFDWLSDKLGWLFGSDEEKPTQSELSQPQGLAALGPQRQGLTPDAGQRLSSWWAGVKDTALAAISPTSAYASPLALAGAGGVTVHNQATFHVEGVSDPQQAADMVWEKFEGFNNDMLRSTMEQQRSNEVAE